MDSEPVEIPFPATREWFEGEREKVVEALASQYPGYELIDGYLTERPTSVTLPQVSISPSFEELRAHYAAIAEADRGLHPLYESPDVDRQAVNAEADLRLYLVRRRTDDTQGELVNGRLLYDFPVSVVISMSGEEGRIVGFS